MVCQIVERSAVDELRQQQLTAMFGAARYLCVADADK